MDLMQWKAHYNASSLAPLVRHLAIIAFAIAPLAACGQQTQELDEDATSAEQNQALDAQEVTCSADLLSGMCRGPWAYKAYATPCYAERQDVACGSEPYAVPRTCLTPVLA